MVQLGDSEINELTKLLTNAFLKDPKIELQMRNIDRKELFLNIQSKNQLESFLEKGDIHRLEDNRGILIGYYSKDINLNDFIEIANRCSAEILKVITDDEMKMLVVNSEKLNNIENPIWFNEIEGEYYHLLVIAIDSKLKGSGAFRKLITPVLDDCDRKNIKVILETHNKDNAGIFKHFGFEVVKEIADSNIHIKQYCMIRNPR